MPRFFGLGLTLAAFVLAATGARADSCPGYISSIMPMPNGAVLFDHSGDRTGLPSCHPLLDDQVWPADRQKLETPATRALAALASR
jgi:hypothetical protein